MAKEFTKNELQAIREELVNNLKHINRGSGDNIEELKLMTSANYSDPNDRAAMESDRSLDLRIRERESKLVKKIKKIIDRIDKKTYQKCKRCDEFIPKERLLARSVTDLCIRCKELEEQDERLS
ncbi:MAG: TraR/DksA C4-type zinc finger protein [SAR324 cluster bacterium]|nr:TraR/DksA C4-type zinc finger protein [SAR324 cluster bacterium]